MQLLTDVKETASLLFSTKSHVAVRLGIALGMVGVMGATTAAAAVPQAHAASCTKSYKIKSGDTLSGIAQHFKSDVNTLAQNNGIADPNLIYAGHQLCVKGVGTVAVSVPQQPQAAPSTSAPAPTVAPSTPVPSVTSTPAPSAPTSPSVPSGNAAPSNVPQSTTAQGGSIASMIDATFGANAPAARAVAECESQLNPNATNPYSGAAGLFQIMGSTWSTTSEAGSSPYNASANIHAAYEIFARDGYSWSEWTCRP